MRSECIDQTPRTCSGCVCQMCGQPLLEASGADGRVREAPDKLEPILSIKEVTDRLGVAPGTIHRWVREGTFPPKIRIGPGRIGWRESSVRAYLAERESKSLLLSTKP